MEIITKLTQQYPVGEYVYGSCPKHRVIIFQKLEDTKTNENQYNVKDPMFAEFYADKLFVVDVISKFTGLLLVAL